MRIEDISVLDNPTLVRDHTLRKLRIAITAGIYPPGARLVERELCEAFGVSRTSVREALRQLQAESLVEVGPRRNIRVAVITAEDATDIYQLREILETQAIQLFVRRADAKALKRLRHAHREMHRALGKGDLMQLAAIAGVFYETLLSGAASRVIYEVALQLLARVNYLRFRSMSEPGRLDDGMREWDAMMDAIEAKDEDAAAKAMTAHLRNSRAAIVQRLLAEERENRTQANR
jgi:DNA-binding GntR family transcriptional regulator